MKERMISMSGGYGLTVGKAGTRPPRVSLRRLRRRIRSFLDRSDQFEWAKFTERVDVAPGESAWAEVELWREILDRGTDILGGQLHLANALVEAGEVDEALKVALEAHEAAPENAEANELIVKLLVFLGRDYQDFPWTEVPKVAALDEKTLERCVQRVSEKGAADAFDLMFDLFSQEVVLFGSEELASFLGSDPRLDVDDEIVLLSR